MNVPRKIMTKVNIHFSIFLVFFTAPVHFDGFAEVVSATMLVSFLVIYCFDSFVFSEKQTIKVNLFLI